MVNGLNLRCQPLKDHTLRQTQQSRVSFGNREALEEYVSQVDDPKLKDKVDDAELYSNMAKDETSPEVIKTASKLAAIGISSAIGYGAFKPTLKVAAGSMHDLWKSIRPKNMDDISKGFKRVLSFSKRILSKPFDLVSDFITKKSNKLNETKPSSIITKVLNFITKKSADINDLAKKNLTKENIGNAATETSSVLAGLTVGVETSQELFENDNKQGSEG